MFDPNCPDDEFTGTEQVGYYGDEQFDYDFSSIAGDYTRTGYTLKGWSLSADGESPLTGTTLDCKILPEICDENKVITVYAIWEADNADTGGTSGEENGQQEPAEQESTEEQSEQTGEEPTV